MEKFITLTHSGGRALINLRHMTGVVEHEGRVYVGGTRGDAMEVFETYDDVIAMIKMNHTEVT